MSPRQRRIESFAGKLIVNSRLQNLEELKFTLSSQEQLNWLHDLHVWIDDILKRVPAMKGDLSGGYHIQSIPVLPLCPTKQRSLKAAAVAGDILQFISGTENEDADHVNTLVALAKELHLLGTKVKYFTGGSQLLTQPIFHSPIPLHNTISQLTGICLQVKLPNGQPLQVQMGMHTGECTTGVVGSLALKYRWVPYQASGCESLCVLAAQ